MEEKEGEKAAVLADFVGRRFGYPEPRGPVARTCRIFVAPSQTHLNMAAESFNRRAGRSDSELTSTMLGRLCHYGSHNAPTALKSSVNVLADSES